jgi:long-chain acyl-CoA synthetase
MMALEEAFQVTIDEAAFAAATTVGDLEALTGRPLDAAAAAETRPQARPRRDVRLPAWNRAAGPRDPARQPRRRGSCPASRPWVTLDVKGLEHLDRLAGPVIFAANHQSHLDGPAILRGAAPPLAIPGGPAMLKEFFKAHFYPASTRSERRFTNSLNYYLASLFFNAFPLPQREAGTRQTLRYIGDLVGDGYSLLIFPEGKRTDGGGDHPLPAGRGDDRLTAGSRSCRSGSTGSTASCTRRGRSRPGRARSPSAHLCH